MAKVLITGGTGLIGTHLCARLEQKGYEVAILSRSKRPGTSVPVYFWDWSKNVIDEEAINGVEFIIHLAGANIADKRWSTKRKALLLHSRVKSAQLLFAEVRKQRTELKTFITASAIGYYGTVTTEKIFTETDPPADDFLGDTCREWEAAADKFEALGIRTVKVRTGVALSEKGGALTKMMTPINLGVGAAIGSGKQYMPWIHIDDLCGIFIQAIEDEQMRGAYNAVAPEHTTNDDFTRTLASQLRKPLWLPNIPTFIIKLIFGKLSDVLLKGSRVSADKIISAGYKYLFPDLKSALSNILIK